MKNIALVTPSFAPDFERCRLLVESVDRYVIGISGHYIVVDRRDFELFKPLASPRTRILVVEDILPDWIYRDPERPNQWTGRGQGSITNWVLQQLVKMSVVDVLTEEVLVFCDSDNAFIRPVDLRERMVRDNRIGLFRVDDPSPELAAWRDVAFELLGLDIKDAPVVNYVGNLIAWSHDHVIAMRNRIAAVHGKTWIRVAARHASISEYVLYGIYIDHVVRLEPSGHIIMNEPLIKPSWNVSLATEADVDRFLSDLDPACVGIMIHSKDNVPVEWYRDKVLNG